MEERIVVGEPIICARCGTSSTIIGGPTTKIGKVNICRDCAREWSKLKEKVLVEAFEEFVRAPSEQAQEESV